ncbi:hypothetical protein KW797_04050 [Candidatus Parcubacteria bacterium]|nr:hypothetical protein [Candidatus Parcubacteria bacterium]
MQLKQFLQLGGTVLVCIGILGFLGIVGPTQDDSLFGAVWWFDKAENWANLLVGILFLGASFILSSASQKPLVLVIGVIGMIVAVSGYVNPLFLGANLETADVVLYLLFGALALWSGLRREKVR